MDNKHMKRQSTSLVIREMQIKSIMMYHLTSIKMTTIKKTQKIISMDKDVEKLECLCTVGENVKYYTHCG